MGAKSKQASQARERVTIDARSKHKQRTSSAPNASDPHCRARTSRRIASGSRGPSTRACASDRAARSGAASRTTSSTSLSWAGARRACRARAPPPHPATWCLQWTRDGALQTNRGATGEHMASPTSFPDKCESNQTRNYSYSHPKPRTVVLVHSGTGNQIQES